MLSYDLVEDPLRFQTGLVQLQLQPRSDHLVGVHLHARKNRIRDIIFPFGLWHFSAEQFRRKGEVCAAIDSSFLLYPALNRRKELGPFL